MSRQYPSHPLPAALAIVIRDGKALLVRRGSEPNRGIWGFPGGLIEVGESPAQAAIRELFEETGITASPGPVIDVFDSITLDPDGGVIYHFLLVAVLCRWEAGDGKAGDDAHDLGWYAADGLADITCAPDLARVFENATNVTKGEYPLLGTGI